MIKLGTIFEGYPAKVGIVTSSIYYEANIVISEVMNAIREEIKEWPISDAKKKFLLGKFSSYANVYDAFITASDSSEIRLKPHPDLFALALHKLSVPKDEYNSVIGFEDSESGTIAMCAAGIGFCVAVPFADTERHDLSAASYISKGGIPEVILQKGIFLI